MRPALLFLSFLSFVMLLPPCVRAQEAPEWFVESFLDVREDAAEAAKDGRRLMFYFMQDGCPYCKQLVTVNFRDEKIVRKMRRHFVPVTINIWGDREVVAADGRRMSEKRFAADLKVQFTPTLVFFDEKGAVAHRINGYLPPGEFYAALDAAIALPAGASSSSSSSSNIDVRRKAGAKPVVLLIAAPACDACAELERHLRSAEVRPHVARFELLRASGPVSVRTARGTQAVQTAYAPSLVFYARGREVFRAEAYLRPFHLASAFEYVASGSYAREPSFQRFLQARAERLRSRGERVDLWN
jgi:thioredoxin-related protein